MASKVDELQIFKGTSVKLDENTLFILAYAVHTETKPDPVTGCEKKNRAKSCYRYIGRVATVKEIQDEIVDALQDVNRLKDWTWPGVTDFKYVSYDGDNTRSRSARWLNSRLKKALPWDMFVKILDGYKPARKAYSSAARYVTDNYVCSDGSIVPDIKKARDVLLKSVGKTFSRDCLLKSQQ